MRKEWEESCDQISKPSGPWLGNQSYLRGKNPPRDTRPYKNIMGISSNERGSISIAADSSNCYVVYNLLSTSFHTEQYVFSPAQSSPKEDPRNPDPSDQTPAPCIQTNNGTCSIAPLAATFRKQRFQAQLFLNLPSSIGSPIQPPVSLSTSWPRNLFQIIL